MPKRIDEYLDLLAGNPVWKSRYQGHRHHHRRDGDRDGPVGPEPARRRASPTTCAARAVPGLRPAASSTSSPREGGDAYDRFMCRTLEMYESVKIVEQCLDAMPAGPVMADDRKYVLPPRHELHTSMESLIHHFKLVTEGFRVPPGQVYHPVESPRGRVRLLPGLRRRAEAVAGALPRAELRQPAVDRDDVGQPLRRRPDRGRRLARRRHGGGRPVTDPATAETLAGARETRPDDAAAGARRRAREAAARPHPRRDRALPRAALGDHPRAAARPGGVRLALDRGARGGRRRDRLHPGVLPSRSPRSTTCSGSRPRARTRSACARTSSCALVGAGDTLRELERELGIHAGQTTRRRRCSRCARSSATAAAAGGPSSRSTSATTSRARPSEVAGHPRRSCGAAAR